jgi:bifunctional UDP-N-acetylglucosamine pyrophosphorylase/glucosamine-1-phosphate N-acetyltransferase
MPLSYAAVVLCAGKGTRMKSEKAKVLHPILGRPLCAYPVARALEVGASPVVPVVGHQSEAVTAALRALFPDRPLTFAVQQEPRGTADAVRSARDALAGFEGPVLILYGDTPLLRAETLSSLTWAYHQSGAPLAMVTTTPPDPQGYGRVVRDAQGQVVRVVEQKDCSREQAAIREVNAGVYVVDSRFLWEALASISPTNAQGELYLTDLVELAARKAKLGVVTADFQETAGVNDRAELAACARILQERINLRHMKAGVTLLDPSSTFIEEGVQIEPDVEVGPQVTLAGKTTVRRRATIGQGSVLTDATVGEETQVKPYTVMEQAEVGPRCIVGPFARLRPGTALSEQVHVGNFVETKKALIGAGTKANHLSYLGDAVIGSGVNVGAGTITCNYDGVNKHQTVVEDGVFIGSDTQLVAPVRVGQGSYVGAGTTVTEDVPPMSLAISRSAQVNKEGWVSKKKKKT